MSSLDEIREYVLLVIDVSIKLGHIRGCFTRDKFVNIQSGAEGS